MSYIHVINLKCYTKSTAEAFREAESNCYKRSFGTLHRTLADVM